MFDLFRDIWILNGILAGVLTVFIQLIGIVAVVVKTFEKK